MAVYSFEPIINIDCKVLILGTMPGVMSLKKQQYYGNDRNAFWWIIYSLFGQEVSESYENRKSFLLQHNIALWDVLKACEREGSSDSDIRDPIPNDFKALYLKHPNIASVCFNGEPARRLYNRYVEKLRQGEASKAFYSLPSTSPAYTISFQEKLEKWKLLLQLL